MRLRKYNIGEDNLFSLSPLCKKNPESLKRTQDLKNTKNIKFIIYDLFIRALI